MVKIRGIFFECNIQDVSTLPFLQITDKSQLPEAPGVYFLLSDVACNGGHNVAYVGEAQNIKSRVVGHPVLRQGDIFGVCWLEVPEYAEAERRVLEKLYIMYYKPPYNKELNGRFI